MKGNKHQIKTPQCCSLCWFRCTILYFLLANCDGISQWDVFIGQYDQNAGNTIERCAPSGPQKHITKESGGFHSHSNLLTMVELQNKRRTKFENNMAQKSLQSLGWNLTAVIRL